jgi:tRNA dimethylallyltransferase
LINVVNPDQPFHAGLYRMLSRKKIEELHQSRKRIWAVGGTGLYLKVMTQGIFPSLPIAPVIRERLKQDSGERGGDFLYQRLQSVDPETALRLHPHDLFRTIRALEVFDSTGIPISFFRGQHRFQDRPYRTLKIGLEIDREMLYRQVEQRVDRMIEKGLLREVEGLMEKGYGPELKPMQSLGYKQMVQFLSKEIAWDEAIRQMKRDTRRYAKRQWTWFKADPEIRWRTEATDRRRLFGEVESFLKEGVNGHDQEPD